MNWLYCLVFLLVTPIFGAENQVTWIAELKNNVGVCLQIKATSKAPEIQNLLRTFKDRGFSVRTYAAIDDGESYENKTYRYVLFLKGEYKSGTGYTEETGDYVSNPIHVLRVASKEAERLRKEVRKWGVINLKLYKIVLVQERIIQSSKEQN